MIHDVTRRDLLRRAVGSGAAVALTGAGALLSPTAQALPSSLGSPRPDQRKLLIVVFGGGTRFSESIGDHEHRYVPRLWHELVPRGTLFTDVRVEHTVVHPNCTGSILTGRPVWDDLDWSRPVAGPTVFEVYRRARRSPDTSAWAFVYASILAHVGHSRSPAFGPQFGANVVVPPTIPRRTAEQMNRLMHASSVAGSRDAQLEAAAECQRLARATSLLSDTGLRSDGARAFVREQYASWKAGTGTTSHDAFLADRAVACMRTFAPDVLVVAFGEIDCAHYGSWSRYVDAIRRTDALTGRLWQTAEQLDAYRGRTLMLVLPDHGRELDHGDYWGFIHHSDFYTGRGADEGCRRVWMLAVGPGVPAGKTIARPVPTMAAAATGLEYLGLEPPPGAGPSVLNETA